MIRTVLTVAITALVVVALYVAREALMLIYVVALVAAVGETIPIVSPIIGGALWGFAGAILAIPTAAILSVIVDELAAGSDASITSAG